MEESAVRLAFVRDLGLLSILFCQSSLVSAIPTRDGFRAMSLVAATVVIPDAQPLPEWARAKQPVPRKALVIGIGTYDHATQLPTPKHDADLIVGALKDVGFQIPNANIIKDRSDRPQLLAAIKQFAASLSEGDVAFVYFSGHGLEREGINYLVPSGAPASTDSPGHRYIPLDYVLGLLEDARVAAAVVVLDACRSDPFAGTNPEDRDLLEPVLGAAPIAATPDPAPVAVTPAVVTPGIAPATAHSGLVKVDTGPAAVLLAYAAQPLQPAFSLRRGEQPGLGSIYTRTVVHWLGQMSGYPIKDIFSLAEADVFQVTNQKQKPFQNPFGLLYLMLAPNPLFQQLEEESWARTVAPASPAQQIENLRLFLRMFPGSAYSQAARQRLAVLSSTDATELLASLGEMQSVPSSSFSVFGKLEALGRDSDGTVLASANQGVVLRQNWNTILKSRSVGTVGAGEVVKVVDVHPGGNAVRVVTSSGQMGYVGDLNFIPANAARQKARLTYADPGVTAEPVDSSPLDSLGPSLAAGDVLVTIATGKGETGGISDQIAHLRALRLRDALIAKGVSPSRVIIQPSAEGLAPGSAEVSTVRIPR